MADINTVPLGQAGTGAAFLLGGSRALQNWMGQNQRNRQISQYNQQQQNLYNQNLAKTYAANRVKEGTGLTWQNEIHGDVAKLTDVASKYLAKGFDVYNPNPRDPNQVQASQQFMSDRAMIDQKINAQKAFEESRDTQNKLYQTDPFQYESESYDNINSFPSKYSAQDVITKGIPFPSVQKIFDYDKNVRDQIPALTTETEKVVGNQRITEKTANVPAIEKYAKNLLSQGQQRNWVEKQIGGSLDGLIGTDDKDEIRKSLDNEFRSPNGVQLIAELTSKGKVPSFDSPQYKKFLDDAVEEQYKSETKYDKILSNAVQDGMAKANPEYKKVNDFSLNAEKRAARGAQLRELANNRAAEGARQRNARFAKWGENKNKDDDFIKDVASGNVNAVNELNAHIGEFNGVAKKVIGTNVNINGKPRYVENGIVVDIPTKVPAVKDANGNTIKEASTVNHRYLIQSKDTKEARIIINQILNKSKSYGAGKTKKEVPYAEQIDQDLLDQGFEP